MAHTVSLTALQQTIARALRQSPDARVRIERAAVLIALGAVERVDETTYLVNSQTGSGERYTVTPRGCTCADGQRNAGRRCKHQWAVRVTLAAEMQVERELAAGVVASAERVAQEYARSIGWAA